MGLWTVCNEKLASVCIRAVVRHGNGPSGSVLKSKGNKLIIIIIQLKRNGTGLTLSLIIFISEFNTLFLITRSTHVRILIYYYN